MLGTIVNAAAVLIGGGVGLLLKRGLPKRVSDAIMGGVALLVTYIGIDGVLDGQKTIVAVLSMVVGAAIGSWIDIDAGLTRLGAFAEKRLNAGHEDSRLAEGFVSASLLFCVGAMAVVGALNSGLSGNHDILLAKALIDGVTACVLASTLGAGVLLSALAVFVYQGAIALLASALAPVLSDAVVAEMSCVGSLLIIGIGLNMLNVTKLKLANYLPAIILPILFCRLFRRRRRGEHEDHRHTQPRIPGRDRAACSGCHQRILRQCLSGAGGRQRRNAPCQGRGGGNHTACCVECRDDAASGLRDQSFSA